MYKLSMFGCEPSAKPLLQGKAYGLWKRYTKSTLDLYRNIEIVLRGLVRHDKLLAGVGKCYATQEKMLMILLALDLVTFESGTIRHKSARRGGCLCSV